MQYVIGVDFGTQSARAIVVRISDGRTLGEAVFAYPSGVMDSALADGTPLEGIDWALEDPRDYLEALTRTVQGAVAQAGVPAGEIGALAIAATACTLMPVDEKLRPLCAQPRFQSRPHAYAKLWKHHRAQPWADEMTKAAVEMRLPRLADYGGRISPEWAQPKVMEVYACDREVYDAADRFMQFSDWLTALLTGDPDVQNGSIAIYKSMWNPREGDLDDAYLNRVGPQLVQIVHEKLRGRKFLAGECAGRLTREMAAILGLEPGVAIGMAHTDGHTAALGGGAAEANDYIYILGTSTCGHLLAKEKRNVPGVTGAWEDGLIRGFTCYSAGQVCAGDMLGWFVRHALPEEVSREAATRGMGVHQLLCEQAGRQRPGEAGLIALDWWGGNRSPLANTSLSGMLLGLTMNTLPCDTYRALLESIAFGHKAILDQFERCGLKANSIRVGGGIAHKNELLLQIMADVLGRPLQVLAEPQATALGAAICAAAALGAEQGGYGSVSEAVCHMRSGIRRVVQPCAENSRAYAPLYDTYCRMSDFFGREEPNWMQKLRRL